MPDPPGDTFTAMNTTRTKMEAAVRERNTMFRLDSEQPDQMRSSGAKATTEKGGSGDDIVSPFSLLGFIEYCDPCACLETRMEPNPVTPASAAANTPNTEVEHKHRTPSHLTPEPTPCSRSGYDANNAYKWLYDEWPSPDYNPDPYLSTSSMEIDVPALDHDLSTSEHNISPSTVRETSLSTSMIREKYGTQDLQQAVPNQGLSTLSVASWIAKTSARNIKDPLSNFVDSSALASLSIESRDGLATEVQSKRVMPPKDKVTVPPATSSMRKAKGGTPKRKPAPVLRTKETATVPRVASKPKRSIPKRKPVPVLSTKDRATVPRVTSSVTKGNGRSKQKPYTNLDVLGGRGGNATHHPGNQRYLAAVRKRLVQYHSCSEKTEKTKVSQQVVDEVHAWGGRFLKKVSKNKYVEEDDKTARKRASQALRDRKPPE